MPIAIRNDDKAKKIQEKILGKPQASNPPSKQAEIVKDRQKRLFTKYKK